MIKVVTIAGYFGECVFYLYLNQIHQIYRSIEIQIQVYNYVTLVVVKYKYQLHRISKNWYVFDPIRSSCTLLLQNFLRRYRRKHDYGSITNTGFIDDKSKPRGSYKTISMRLFCFAFLLIRQSSMKYRQTITSIGASFRSQCQGQGWTIMGRLCVVHACRAQ